MDQWQNQEGEEYLQYPIQNGVCERVMTDEQIEQLRKQISAYAVISEQLAETFKAMSAHHDFTGLRLGNPYFDPLAASFGHKITARQRWTPTALQLQVLESIYDRGNGTPSKQKIKQITIELAQHGQISETNVYNWFQNRRARSKRKLQGSATTSTEPEADANADGLAAKEKSTKSESMEYIDPCAEGVENFYFQNSDTDAKQMLFWDS